MKLLIVLSLVVHIIAEEKPNEINEIMSHPNWRLFNSTKCGVVNHDTRITMGEYTNIERFPWLAQVLDGSKIKDQRSFTDSYICGAALINRRYLLTAAHCVYEKQIKYVKLGESTNVDRNKCKQDCAPKRVKISEIIQHEQYDPTNYENDIALIRLHKEVEYNSKIQPICLPRDNLLEDAFISEKVLVAGWGKDSSETFPELLKYVMLPIRDRCVCETIYNKPINESRWCIGLETGKDTCEGDSGSPVVWSRIEQLIKRHYIIGITSFGDEDCGQVPAIYTNVNRYVKWILDHVYDDKSKSNQ